MPKDITFPSTSHSLSGSAPVASETAPSHSKKIIENTNNPIQDPIEHATLPITMLSTAIPLINNITNDHDKELQLIDACEKGDTDKVRNLLESGINPNLRDQSDKSLLTQAYRSGHKEIAHILIHHPRIDIDAYGKDREDCLFLAYKKRDQETIELLLTQFKKRIDEFNSSRGNKNDWDYPVRTISFHTNAPTKSQNGYEFWEPLLLRAYQDNHIDLVKRLVNLGADVNEISYIAESAFFGYSLLTLAWCKKDDAMVEFVLQNGADPQVKIDNQPLLVLAYQQKKLFETLLKYHANPNVYDADCQYIIQSPRQKIIWPLIMAAYLDQLFDIVDLLIKYGADINAREEVANDDPLNSWSYPDRKSLLMMAYLNNNIDMMHDLLKRGADPAIAADENEHSVLQMALHDNRQDIIQLVWPYGNLQKMLSIWLAHHSLNKTKQDRYTTQKDTFSLTHKRKERNDPPTYIKRMRKRQRR